MSMDFVPENRAFSQLVRRTVAAPAHARSVLADAHQECTYLQIPAYLQVVQSFLSAQQVRGGCITLELTNSVPAALTLLAALDAGYSIMLMPVQGQGARAGEVELPAPRFSRWIVTSRSGASACDLSDPSTYLQVRPNPDFDAASNAPEESRPCVYARTSGSLGAPKLAVHGYGKLRDNVLGCLVGLQLGPAHRIALPTPIYHMFGFGGAFLPAFAGGACVDLQERSNLLRFLEREEAFNPNVAFVTPSFCEALTRSRKSPRLYRFMITGGDRMSEASFFRSEEKHGPLINMYGTTEMGAVAAGTLSMPSDLRARTVGLPFPGVECRFVESTSEALDEPMSELQIRHANAFQGYVDLDGRPVVRASAFDGEWYRTGDLAKPGPEGTVQILGRCDLSVNRRGLLLPFAEVESVLREIDGVEEVAVAAGPESIRGRALVAFCVLARGVELSGDQLRARQAERLPPFALPDTVQILQALPRLASGKIDRRSLANMANDLCTQHAAGGVAAVVNS
jgi:acyl-coenzyme A synthetase/AMP-(fatty) acid ligase